MTNITDSNARNAKNPLVLAKVIVDNITGPPQRVEEKQIGIGKLNSGNPTAYHQLTTTDFTLGSSAS